MGIRQDIATILTSRECQNINFELRGMHVTGEMFRRVADRILDTSPPIPIRIATNPAILPRRAEAMYDNRDSGNNTLYLRRTDVMTDSDMRATIVHECTHIIWDIRCIPVVGMDNEAASYIAQTWYLINLQGPAAADPDLVDVVSNIMVRSGGGGRPASVTQEERHQIHRTLIGFGYSWRNTVYSRPDGVRGARRE